MSSFVELIEFYLNICRSFFKDIGLLSCGWSKYVIYAIAFIR
jgi:hypothetical protein